MYKPFLFWQIQKRPNGNPANIGVNRVTFSPLSLTRRNSELKNNKKLKTKQKIKLFLFGNFVILKSKKLLKFEIPDLIKFGKDSVYNLVLFIFVLCL